MSSQALFTPGNKIKTIFDVTSAARKYGEWRLVGPWQTFQKLDNEVKYQDIR